MLNRKADVDYGRTVIVALALCTAMNAMAGNKVHDADIASLSDHHMCSPMCVEAVVSVDHVLLWTIDRSNARTFLFQYTPDWSIDPTNRPAEPGPVRKRYTPKNAEVAASADASNPCGADGWGYALGQETFTAMTPGQVIVSATYVGLGKQLITSGSSAAPIQVAAAASTVASASTRCQALRAAAPEGPN